MKNLLTFFYLATLLACVFSEDIVVSLSTQTIKTIHNIMETFMSKGNTKETFKVWHSLYRPDYDINTEKGINKYKAFRSNVRTINQINSEKLSWTAGTNNYSDMTVEEKIKYFNIVTMTDDSYKQTIRGLLSLDDYDDSQDTMENSDPLPPQDKKPIDWTKYLNEARDQGSCGSCWAFSAVGAIEGNYSVLRKGAILSPILSIQQLMDCNYSDTNKGCSGGNMKIAITYFRLNKGISAEKDYGYIQRDNQGCKYKSTLTSGVLVTGAQFVYTNDIGIFNFLLSGPIATCINMNSTTGSKLFDYKSGIFTDTCKVACNHGVVLIGWNTSPEGNYWIVRNSWGRCWGENGNFRILDYGVDNAFSCMVGSCAMSIRPLTN